MKMTKNDTILRLPKDFCGACNMFNIHPLTALQFYIKKSTIYSTLVKDNDAACSFAKILFIESCKLNDEKTKMEGYKRIAGIKYVKEVVKIITGKDKPSKKELRYKNIISEWYEDIESVLPPKTIETSNGFTIFLTKDFCIVCDIFQTTPIKVLQYYVNRVSIPKYIDSTEKDECLYATAFFLQYPSIIKQINAT